VTASAKSQPDFPVEASTTAGGASLESILCTEELQRRGPRPPDYEEENRALVALVSALADSPGTILQTLAETILEITESDSAGLSLLTRDDDGKRFYWPAIAGMWNPHVGGGTPRNFGPCGDVLDRNCTLLFTHFERRYPYLIPVMPPADECLLVPFYVGGRAVGTIWAIMHSDRHKFDAEDERVMGSLGRFASSAYQAVVSIDDLKFQVAEREKAETELRKLADGLETKVLVRTEELEQRNSQIAEARARLAEEKLALERSEAFLAEAQHLSSTGSFCWRPSTGEIRWSEQLYRIFEIEQGVPVTLELIGSRIHPEDISILNDMIERTRTAVSDFEYDYRLLMPDHSVKHVHAFAHGSRDAGGQLEYIGAVQDVTQRRASEEALAKARSELAHVTRVMSLSALTASIAHEVSQPLSGMVTNASTCLRMLSSDPPNVEGARETARRMIRDGNRASDVITRLRALFGKKDATIEVIDLNEAVREVIALSLSELQSNRVILRHQLANDLPPVTGDRVQLQQVILNLLRNASDAMNTLDDRPRELLITTERDEGDRARLSVKDAGVGLDPEAMDQLFEAFYTTKNDGMGIGLPVCRSIIEKHCGLIWATQNDGPGATFSFSIPCRIDTKVQ
jgi:signal transduction histidine kinase/GAF domain-containing protein